MLWCTTQVPLQNEELTPQLLGGLQLLVPMGWRNSFTQDTHLFLVPSYKGDTEIQTTEVTSWVPRPIRLEAHEASNKQSSYQVPVHSEYLVGHFHFLVPTCVIGWMYLLVGITPASDPLPVEWDLEKYASLNPHHHQDIKAKIILSPKDNVRVYDILKELKFENDEDHHLII